MNAQFLDETIGAIRFRTGGRGLIDIRRVMWEVIAFYKVPLSRISS